MLEAMACGIPLITSNISSMPEINGDAGILIDPHNEQELEDAILNVLEDTNLRKQMIEKGFKRAKEFSWERCAQQTLDVLDEVMKLN